MKYAKTIPRVKHAVIKAKGCIGDEYDSEQSEIE